MYAAGIPILVAHDDCQQTEWPLKMPTLLSQSHHLGATTGELPGKGQSYIRVCALYGVCKSHADSIIPYKFHCGKNLSSICQSF